jgi:DNA-binding transcriptional LysR family regulator
LNREGSKGKLPLAMKSITDRYGTQRSMGRINPRRRQFLDQENNAKTASAPAYFAAQGTPKIPDDLADHMGVSFTALAHGMTWVFDAHDEGPIVRVRPFCRLKVNTAESAIDAAIAGVGVTNVMSYQIARAVSEGKLSVVQHDYRSEPIPVHLVHAAQTLIPLKMRRFMEFGASRLRKSLAALRSAR